MARYGVGAWVCAGVFVFVNVLLSLSRTAAGDDDDDDVEAPPYMPALVPHALLRYRHSYHRNNNNNNGGDDERAASASLLSVVAYAFVERHVAFAALSAATLLVGGHAVEAAIGTTAFALLLLATTVGSAVAVLAVACVLRLLCVTDVCAHVAYSGAWPLLEAIAVALCGVRGGAAAPLVATSASAATQSPSSSRWRRSRALRGVLACVRVGHVPLAWLYVALLRGVGGVALDVVGAAWRTQPPRGVDAARNDSHAHAHVVVASHNNNNNDDLDDGAAWCDCVVSMRRHSSSNNGGGVASLVAWASATLLLPTASMLVAWLCVRLYARRASPRSPHTTTLVVVVVPWTSLLYPACLRRAALSLASCGRRALAARRRGGKSAATTTRAAAAAAVAAASATTPRLPLPAMMASACVDGAAAVLLPGSTAEDAERRRRIALAALAQRLQQQQQQQRQQQTTTGDGNDEAAGTRTLTSLA